MAMQDLLEDLIDTSPIIAESISNYNVEKELVGEVTLNDLVIKACDVLLDILENNGILFHVDRFELFGDFYNARFLIYLYKTFIPVFFRSRLNNDCDLYNKITAILDNVSGNEYIVTLLRFFAESEGTQFDRDMYVFLNDKITNADEYYMSISVILAEIAIVCDNEHTLSNSEDTTKFLSALFVERTWVKGMISKLAGRLDLSISELEILSSKFRLDMINGDLVYMYHQARTHGDILANHLLIKRISKLRERSIFYPEHYKHSIKVNKELIFMMILTSISDRRLFSTALDYSRILNTFTEYSHFISNAIKLVSLEV